MLESTPEPQKGKKNTAKNVMTSISLITHQAGGRVYALCRSGLVGRRRLSGSADRVQGESWSSRRANYELV